MKKIFFIPAACLMLFGCADKKKQEQAVFDSIMTVHNKLMGADERLLKNKSDIDSLIKISPAGAFKDSAKIYSDKALMADSAMDTWMHDFKPDRTTRSHDDNIVYFGKQKKLIMQVDSQINGALTASGKFLTKTKSK